jgi:hypothetical protein
MARKKRLSSKLGVSIPGQPKAGAAPYSPAKGPVGAKPMRMPGQRSSGSQAVRRAPQVAKGSVQSRIQWSAPKKNTTGNARTGSDYREGIDPVTGRKYTMYEAQAGGVPREIFEVGKPAASSLGRTTPSALRRRLRRSNKVR